MPDERQWPIRAGLLVTALRQVGVGLAVCAAASVACLVALLVTGLGGGICAFCVLILPAIIGGGLLGRRVDRALDARNPGITLKNGTIHVPVDGQLLTFDAQTAVMAAGWWSRHWNLPATDGIRHPSEGCWVYLGANGVEVLLSADDGTGGLSDHRVAAALPPKRPLPTLRVWSTDLNAVTAALLAARPAPAR